MKADKDLLGPGPGYLGLRRVMAVAFTSDHETKNYSGSNLGDVDTLQLAH